MSATAYSSTSVPAHLAISSPKSSSGYHDLAMRSTMAAPVRAAEALQAFTHVVPNSSHLDSRLMEFGCTASG